jgi:DNA-binding transcriptional ArsR family regulator
VKRHRDWYLLSAHGLVLLHFGRHPDSTVAETARALDLHPRHVSRVIGDLREAGLLRVTPAGRRRRYEVNLDAELRHRAVAGHRLAEVLPLLAREPEPPRETAAVGAKPGGRARPVALLVMPQSSLANGLQASIQQIGFDIRRALSEQEAFVEAGREDIDVVVVDGRLNGDELGRRLKRKGLPVFVVTPDVGAEARGQVEAFSLWALRPLGRTSA